MSNALKFLLELDAGAASRALAAFQAQLNATLRTASSSNASGGLFDGIKTGATGAVASVAGLASSLLSLKLVAVASAGAFAKASIDAAEQTQNAFNGLESVANRTGVGIEKAWKAVIDLTSDGLLSQTEAATALKNLFARGFNIEESIKLIKAFKDSAAFGRQASLSFGEAVVSATEGLKNENSVLVDNAGVTKNVAKMWDEYAKSIGTTADQLTTSQKRQAEYKGVLEETAAQTGDAEKLQKELGGANARLAKSFTDLKTTIGDQLKPAYKDLIDLTATLLSKTNEYLKKSQEALKPSAVTENKGAVGIIARTAGGIQRGIESAFGLPPAIPPRAQIPSNLINTTGVGLVAPGPGGKPIVNNIDEQQAAKRRQKEAEENAQAAAKQELKRSQDRLKREKQDSDNELQIFASGLEARKALLERSLAAETISKAEYARQASALEVQELQKGEELRAKRIIELRKQVDIATRTGNKELQAEAEQALRNEEAQAAISANRLKAIRAKAGAEAITQTRQDAQRQQQLNEQLVQAQVEGERTKGAAIRDAEIAEVEKKVAARTLTEEEGLKQIAALKDAEFVAELARIKRLQELYKDNPTNDAEQAAKNKAALEKLSAQETAVQQERLKSSRENDAKLLKSTEETNRIRAELEQDLLEVQGKTFEAQSAQIDAWLEEKKKQLANFPELLAKAEQVAQGKRKNLGFENAQEGIRTLQNEFSAQQDELYRRSQQGLITDIEYDRQSLELKKQQAAVLRERLELLRQNSNGSASAVATIKGLEQEIATLDSAMSETAKSINDNFFNALEQGFNDLFTGAKKPLEALRDVAISVLKQIASMALRNSLQSLFSGMGGAGGGLGGAVASLFGGFRAAGGAVDGGTAYITGERGPELFVPGQPGNVVPTGRLMQVLTGMLSQQRRPSVSGFRAAEPAPVNASTSVSVAPKVVVAAGDFLNAIRSMPEAEKWIVEVAASNGKRIQSGW